MTAEIKVRKPRAPKWFGIAALYERYTNAWYKWRSLLPRNGDRIKLTWLPAARNAPTEVNAYIGMEGIVADMDMQTGSFVLDCETSRLICMSGSFNYEIIKSRQNEDTASSKA